MSTLLSGEIDLNGYTSHSEVARHAALANHTARAIVGAAVNIVGKPNTIMTLRGIQVTVKSVATTVVMTGGLLELENDAVDWIPCRTYLNTSTFVGANAGAAMTPTIIPLHKPLPAGSNVSCWYTAFNAATDQVEVALIWTTEPYSGSQTYIVSGIGALITQVTEAAAHIALAIPATKGGKGIGFLAQVVGTMTTILATGGRIAVTNPGCSPSIEPMRFSIGSVTGIGTGGAEYPLLKMDHNFDCPGNTTFTIAYMPESAQSQQLAFCVAWEG